MGWAPWEHASLTNNQQSCDFCQRFLMPDSTLKTSQGRAHTPPHPTLLWLETLITRPPTCFPSTHQAAQFFEESKIKCGQWPHLILDFTFNCVLGPHWKIPLVIYRCGLGYPKQAFWPDGNLWQRHLSAFCPLLLNHASGPLSCTIRNLLIKTFNWTRFVTLVSTFCFGVCTHLGVAAVISNHVALGIADFHYSQNKTHCTGGYFGQTLIVIYRRYLQFLHLT